MINAYKSSKAREKVLNSYDELLRLWDIEFVEEDVTTTFGSTHCILAGDSKNPPLLLLHGVGDNSAVMWVFNIKEFSRHFFCIALDTLGGPGKSIPNESFTRQKFSQTLWINEIADHYRLGSFNIAGVSNGAVMAFNYAARESGRIGRVVCMEGGMVIKPLKAMVNTIGMMFPEFLIPTDKNLKRVMEKLSSPDSDVFKKNPQIVDHLVLVMRSHNQGAMFVHRIEKYNKEAASAVRDKILFLIGGYRADKKKDFIDLLNNDGYKYKIIQKAGHGINHEQPEIVNEAVIEFLSHEKCRN